MTEPSTQVVHEVLLALRRLFQTTLPECDVAVIENALSVCPRHVYGCVGRCGYVYVHWPLAEFENNVGAWLKYEAFKVKVGADYIFELRPRRIPYSTPTRAVRIVTCFRVYVHKIRPRR